MKNEQLCSLIGEIDDEYIAEAEAFHASKRRIAWLRAGALAACLCIMLTAVLLPLMRKPEPVLPNSPAADGPPRLVLDGTTYIISPYLEMSEALPDGFVCAGSAPVDGFDSCDCFTNPDFPGWVYVLQEVYNNVTGESRMKYVRYVDAAIRGKDYVCVDDVLYISLWSAPYDATQPLYDRAEQTYGVRIEGSAPEGFTSLGKANFSGHDTIPRGALASNTGTQEVLTSAGDSDVILVSTAWHTAPDSTGEMRHTGWNVYIRCS